MIAKKYVCDDCGAVSEFTSYVKARAAHWAVSKDYEKCYCPNCAPEHRFGKAAEKNDDFAALPNAFQQLKIENL